MSLNVSHPDSGDRARLETGPLHSYYSPSPKREARSVTSPEVSRKDCACDLDTCVAQLQQRHQHLKLFIESWLAPESELLEMLHRQFRESAVQERYAAFVGSGAPPTFTQPPSEAMWRAGGGSKAGGGTRTIPPFVQMRSTAYSTEEQQKLNHAKTVLGHERTSEFGDISEEERTWCQKVVRTPFFEWIIVAAILGSTASMGIEVECKIMQCSPQGIQALWYINCFFAVIFLFELISRVMASCMAFLSFRNPDFNWNVMDSLFVAHSGLQIIIEVAFKQEVQNFFIMRVIRCVRMLRMARMIRLMRFFRHLRILVLSILFVLRSLMWAMLLLCMIIYIFAFIFTQASMDEPSDKVHPELSRLYGSMFSSALTLFQSVSGGINWSEALRPLSRKGRFYEMFLLCFICLTTFAVLNVVTGVFCQNAIESAQRDMTEMVDEQLKQKEKYVKWPTQEIESHNLFAVSPDGKRTFTFLSFEKLLKEKSIRAFFLALDIDAKDAWNFFKLLDTEEEGIVLADQLIEACLQFKGPAKNIDIARVLYENRWTRKRITSMAQATETCFTRLNDRMDFLERSLMLPRHVAHSLHGPPVQL